MGDSEKVEDRGPAGQAHVWESVELSTPDLAGHLLHVAQVAANAALRNYAVETSHEAFWGALSAGLAVEALLKYSIALEAPMLLADTKSRSASALILARSHRLAFDIATLKTVNGMDSFALFKAIHGEQKGMPSGRDVEQVFEIRNAVAHMGVVSLRELRVAVQNMVRIVESVMAIEAPKHDGLWDSSNLEIVDMLLNEKASDSQRALTEKKAIAARRYEQLLGNLSQASADDFVRSIESRVAQRVDDEQVSSHSCPVCGSRALLFRYVTQSDTDFTGASYPDNTPSGYRYAYPESFECWVCGLEMDEAEIGDDPRFEEVLEVELDPSDDFELALEDWRYEAEAEIERERRREEEREFDR